MWECPECHRNFRSPNQSHSCKLYPLESHFLNRNAVLEIITRTILEHIEHWKGIRVTSVKNALLVAAASTFLAIKVKSDRVDLELLLREEHDGFPVYKTVRVSKNRVAHFIALDRTNDLDETLFGLISQAYRENQSNHHLPVRP
ncbi:MAG: hypothetical protein JXA23_03230 [Bacteroidales bacterium]|nr:hypothetical protein [Bacteroidales bacterium]